MSADIILTSDAVEVLGGALLLKRTPDDEHPVRIRVQDGNVLLGGEGDDGDLLLYDRAGNLTIGLNGESGSLHLGGNTEDGDVVLRDGDGRQTLHLDGATGDVKTEGGSIRFGNAEAPMLYIFESGTSNPDRPVLAHSPRFEEWACSTATTVTRWSSRPAASPSSPPTSGDGAWGLERTVRRSRSTSTAGP